MKNFLNKYKYQLLLVFITVIVFFINYSPGTYLSGWDNLQTELNPGLAVRRAIFSVWEEYQSLGLTAGMAHAADLVRASFLWLMSLVLPQQVVRYFFHFLMLALGGFGMFQLLGGGIVAFVGSLFYMFNLGTLQIFYVPFEPFSSFFAFLPWGIWSFLKIIDNDKQSKNWFIFFLINLLGTPSFYTQQLFVVYLLVLSCIALANLKNIKRVFIALSLILVINSFWILPQLYFLKTNGNWIAQAKINQIATEDTLYQNLSKGTLDNFLRLEGFYFDLAGIKNMSLFFPWKDQFSGIAQVLPYGFALLMILGLIKSVQEKKYSFLLLFFLCALALLSVTPPFSWVNNIIRQNGFINQIFRSPFTKFIIPYSLVYSFFVAQGFIFIIKKLPRNFKSLITIITLALIFFYSYPSFKGYFISPEMKVKIPNDYFQVMDYLKNEDKSKRIALLPDYTFWGWFFNKWGYNGSGFLWYGIEQPIISRTFDVWNPKSEGYFWEEKQALEAENLSKFEAVLDKYNVDYLILDYSLIPVVSSYKSLGLDRVENLVNSSNRVSLVFRGENVALFQVNHPKKIQSFISVASNLNSIGPEINLMSEDHAYQESGDYISSKDYDLYYPFADLNTQTRLKNKYWHLSESNDFFSISSDVDLDFNNYQFYLPATSSASLVQKDKITDLKLNLEPSFENKKIKIDFQKLLIKSFDVGGFDNNSKEFSLDAPDLPQKYGYLIKVRSKNIKGSPKFDYGLGYSFVFQNKSYENYPSENILEEVSVYLFPYEELKDVKFTKNNLYLRIANYSNDFLVKKNNYFTYEVKTASGDMVILNQSYDPGWVAFGNGKILRHVKVNNWANGWVLDDEINPENVKIIFWPQYLEFLGFILLAGAGLRILIIKK